MKTLLLIEELILEASKKDILINKLGFSENNADILTRLAGNLSIFLGNKLINAFAEIKFERTMGILPEEEEKKLRELFRTDANYRKEIGADAINRSSGVNGMRSSIISIMDWIRIGLNGDVSQYKNLNFHELYSESRKWHNELTSGEGDINYVENNEILRDYRDSDGIGFYWTNLKTNDSREECNRMGHCGRTGLNNTVYSLRETKKIKDNYTLNKSHLTAAVGKDDNIIYQLKGPKNSKPKSELHPYIVDLILNTNINGFGSEYDSSSDFKITDLSEEEIRQIYNVKPALFNTRSLQKKLFEMGIIKDFQEPKMVFELKIEPDSVRFYVEGDWTIRQTKDDYGRTKKVYFIETLLSGSYWNIYDNDYGEWKSALEYEVNKENYETIENLIKIKSGNEYDPDMSLKDLIEQYDGEYEIRDALSNTYNDAASSSYYNYAINQLKNALSEYGEVLKLDDTGATIKIDLKDVIHKKGLGDTEVNEYFENCDEDPACVFAEILGDYHDKPIFSLDNRWTPDINRNEFNEYLSERLNEI
jgi:hypothetical protein